MDNETTDNRIQPIYTPADRPLILFWLFFSVLSTALLFTYHYPAMVDAPHFVGSVNVWKNLSNANFIDANLFEVKWFRPYLLPTFLARAIAYFTDALSASKTVLLLALLSLPLSYDALLRRVNGERYLALLGFAIFFGYGFQWGMITFTCSLPLAILIWAWTIDFVRLGSWISSFKLSILATALSFTHGITAAYIIFISCSMIAFSTSSALTLRKRLTTIILSLLPLIALSGLMMKDHISTQEGFLWAIDFERFSAVAATLFGNEYQIGYYAGMAIFIGLAILFTQNFQINLRSINSIPFIIILAVLLLGPKSYHYKSLLYRLSPFFFAALILLLNKPSCIFRRFILQLCIILVCTSQFISQNTVFAAYNYELAALRNISERIPPYSKVASKVMDVWLPQARMPMFNHAVAWIQAERVGVTSGSFMLMEPYVVRYKAPIGSLEWERWTAIPAGSFDTQRLANYNYIVARLDNEKKLEETSNKLPQFRPTYREQRWILYTRAPLAESEITFLP